MKKTLVAAAILGSFAASAFAAPNFDIYGKIDTGLVYTHADVDVEGVKSVDTVSMESGWNAGSRWGLKGTEDLGNAKVGFILESGFSSDDGVSGQNGRLFGRQATISVSSSYGTFYAGRLGGVSSDIGSVGMLGGVSPFGSSFSDLGTHGSTGTAWARYDNAIAYASPVINGFYGNAMYSFKADTQNKVEKDLDENHGDVTRYAAAGIGYKAGALDAVLVVDYTLHGNKSEITGDLNDGWSLTAGGNYDFGVATGYAKINFFDRQTAALDSIGYNYYDKDINPDGAIALKGWGMSVGAKVPAFGGNFLAEIGYRNAKDVEDNDNEFKRWNVTVGYNYTLSKRTSVYATGGWVQEKAKAYDATPYGVLVGAGLIHNF